MNTLIENNQVSIIGEVVSEFIFSHEVHGEKFYIVFVDVPRFSSNNDRLIVTVSDHLLDVSQDYRGEYIEVNGNFRSYNKQEDNGSRLILSVFARELRFVEEEIDKEKENVILLDGYIVKEPVYRKTPLGREITDLLIAVNRPYGKSDYIPCICWGRNALFAARLVVGENVKIKGRIQSRKYKKALNENEYEEKVCYEVSIQTIEIGQVPCYEKEEAM